MQQTKFIMKWYFVELFISDMDEINPKVSYKAILVYTFGNEKKVRVLLQDYFKQYNLKIELNSICGLSYSEYETFSEHILKLIENEKRGCLQ